VAVDDHVDVRLIERLREVAQVGVVAVRAGTEERPVEDGRGAPTPVGRQLVADPLNLAGGAADVDLGAAPGVS
jgi:hypothetical protein